MIQSLSFKERLFHLSDQLQFNLTFQVESLEVEWNKSLTSHKFSSIKLQSGKKWNTSYICSCLLLKYEIIFGPYLLLKYKIIFGPLFM